MHLRQRKAKGGEKEALGQIHSVLPKQDRRARRHRTFMAIKSAMFFMPLIAWTMNATHASFLSKPENRLSERDTGRVGCVTRDKSFKIQEIDWSAFGFRQKRPFQFILSLMVGNYE